MNKRRAIIPQKNKITQSFQTIKHPQSSSTQQLYAQFKKNHQDFQEIPRGLNMHFNGAHNSNTPYRSTNRLNSLLKPSQYQVLEGKGKAVEAPKNILGQLSQKNSYQDDSKPSSVTTAITNATTVYDYPQNKRQEKKRDKKVKQQKQQESKLVGKKRTAQLKIDQMEYFSRLPLKRLQCLCSQITLRQKKTGKEQKFNLFSEKDIYNLKTSLLIKDFESKNKLEVEFDYDTDNEMIIQSKKMMLDDLFDAIEFFVVDDPTKLVNNVNV